VAELALNPPKVDEGSLRPSFRLFDVSSAPSTLELYNPSFLEPFFASSLV